VRIKSDSQLEVGNKDANTINLHASHPEPDCFSIRLHCLWLVQTEDHSEENDQCVPKSIEDPLHEKALREAFSSDSNTI